MANIFELNVNINAIEKTEAQKALEKTTNGENTENKIETPESSGKKTAAAIGAMVISSGRQIANQVISFETSKIGSLYGDTARQNEINNMMSGVNTVAGIAQMAASGAAIGGPWGAAIGAIVGIVGEGIQMVQRGYMYTKEEEDRVRNSNYAQERLGILTASKGR